jgi:hypothetical protein
MATASQYGDAQQHGANAAIGLCGLWRFQKAIPALVAVKQGIFAMI